MSRNTTGRGILRLALVAAAAAASIGAQAADNTQINNAIDKGLLFLHDTQDQASGSWTGWGGYPLAHTGAAAFGMLSQQSRWGSAPAGVDYAADVQKAMNYLLANASITAVSTRNDGVKICPGGAASCSAVWWPQGGEDSYTTGLVSSAVGLYAQGKLNQVATTSGNLAGMTWGEIAQAIVNTWSASQSTTNQGNRQGGWRYGLNAGYDSDSSTTQWGSISLTYMSALGAQVPAEVKTDLAKFLRAVQTAGNGSACYQPGVGPCDHADTGGLLLGMAYLGFGKGDPTVAGALAYVNNTWTEPANGVWYGNIGHPYATWAVYKGLETQVGLNDTSTITNLYDPGCDSAGAAPTSGVCNWWQDYNNYIVATQDGNGGWAGYSYWGATLATSFYLPILGGTMIPVQPGVPEPATLALIGLALAGAAAFRRRRGA